MATWSRNHRACETTWTTLYALSQLRAAFPAAGIIPMRQLTFWDQESDTLDVRSRSLATNLDGVFVRVRGAEYEDGVNQESAISGLVTILKVGSKVVADLAEAADAQYRFWGEGEGSYRSR